MASQGVTLRKCLEVLGEIAPLDIAEEWDNVGLLLQPLKRPRISSLLLTIDMTEEVVREAARKRAQMVVAYHPPIFDPLRSLTMAAPTQRALMAATQAGLCVYSPHTALDAVEGGVNDWLAAGLCADGCAPLAPHLDDPQVGQGRLLTYRKGVTWATFLRRVKQHLGLSTLRVAKPSGKGGGPIRSVALCAGAGASVLMGTKADVYLTGEMRHHDVLAAIGHGHRVVLCEHTNTERGYLPILKSKLRKALGTGVSVAIARTDREPLQFA